jgi:Protein of unknown function (DUF4231)
MMTEPMDTGTTTAYQEAASLVDWYVRNGRASRVRFQIAEVVLLVFSSSVPVAGILTPHDARLPAILGAIVVLLTGLRTVFHWRDNWMRFTFACREIKAEMRIYDLGAYPYDDPATRDAVLTAKINDVEKAETSSWMTLGGPDSASRDTKSSSAGATD